MSETDALKDPSLPQEELPRLHKKPSKKFIKSTVTVHDRTQIEAVFDYFLLTTPVGEHKGSLRYKVEAFFFFPPQLGLTDATYPKERFYADVRPLIRFREPRLGFKRMRGLKPGSDSPLLFLKQYVAALAQGVTCPVSSAAVDEVRIFACSLIGNFLKTVDRWRRRFDRLRMAALTTPEDLEAHFSKMTRLLGKMHDTLVEFRHIAAELDLLPEDTDTALKTEMRLIDEYCYYRLRDGIAFLLLISDGFRHQEHITAISEFNARVREVLAFHDEHAAQCDYMLIRRDSPETVKEHYLRRRGELKRRIWGVLFLDLRAVRMFAFRQQLGPMIAAGLAAIWAVVTQFTIIHKAMGTDRVVDLLGISGLFFVLVFAGAYVVKDRIKEISRSYFRRGLFRNLPDHSERIYYEPRRGNIRAIGNLTETAKFQKLSNMPKQVAKIRAAHELFETPIHEDDDTVLHYIKEVKLATDIKILNRYPLRAVHDILRFNIDSFLPRLGEPMRAINIIDENLRVHAVGFPKVYHIDLALRYSRVSRTVADREDSVDYFRLVLDKTGLIRVERLT